MSCEVQRPSNAHSRTVSSEHVVLLGPCVVEELVDLFHDLWATVSVGFLYDPDERTLFFRVSVGVVSLVDAYVHWWNGLCRVLHDSAVAVRVTDRVRLQDEFDLQLASDSLYPHSDDDSLILSEDIPLLLSVAIVFRDNRTW